MKEKDKKKEKLTNESQVSNEIQWLRAEQVKPLYTHAPVNMLSVLAFSLLMTFILWQVISHTVLIIWLSCNLLITLLRYLLIYRYKRASAESLKTGRWGNWFAIGMAFNGILWGSAGIWLFAEGSIPHQVLLALVMAGMVAGAVGSYSVMMKVFMAYTIPTMTPITILFFAQGSDIHVTIGVMAVIFTMTMMVTARRINTIAISSLRLQFENRNLIAFLTTEKERTEKLNQDLTAKIAAHKQAEEELRASEERYKDLVFSTSDWVWETDAKGFYTYCSYKIEDILGYTPEEIIGKTPFDLMPKDEAARIGKIFRDIAKNKQPIKELENWNIHKDGHRVCLLTNGVPKLDPEGNLIGYRGVDKDITERRQAEEVIQIEKAYLEQLFESAQEAILVADNDSRVMRVNSEFTRLFGYTRDETLGRLLDDLIAPKHLRDEAVSITKRAAKGERVTLETIRQRKDRTMISVSVLASPIIIGDEQVAVYTIYRDITERKRAEEALRESEKRYRTLFEDSIDAIYITTRDGAFIDANQSMLDLLGYTREEMVDLNAQQLYADPMNSKSFIKNIEQKGFVRDFEVTLCRKDGTEIDCLFNVSMRRTDDGSILGYQGIIRDITERKRAEEALERFRLLMEISPDPVVVYDIEGKSTYINRAFEQTYGWSHEELSGKRIDFVPPQEAERTREHVERTKRGESVSFETQRLTKDGRVLDVQIKTAFFQDRVLESLGVGIVIHRDITELKQVEAELKRAKVAAEAANRAKTEFLASMSHEIRTPMNAIIGMADLLRETPLTLEQQQYVQVFSSAGENLLNIINDILDISKVEAGHLDLEDIDFDLIEVVEKTCEVIALRAHEKGLELAYHVMPDVPSQLVGDPVRLRQILMNLIGNAIKFTENGEVFVEVKRQGSGPKGQRAGDMELLFSVADTGIGIPPEKVDVIFDSFAQADTSTTRKHGGTGLGLTISRRLVELMGGRIWVKSKVDQGSTFYFTAKFQVQAEPKRYLQPPPVDMKGLKILVVDDNATNRMILREMLSGWGALVTEAGDGEHGIAELKHAMETEGPYKLLLLDCYMPGMDGFQVVEYIKENLHIADMTIMMLTSERRSDDIARCKKLGIACYLVKPIKRSELFEAITATIGKTKMVAEEPAVTRPAAFEDLSGLHILLVEDSVENRLLIQSYLKKTPYQIDIAENGEIAVEKFKSGKYDLVLMDMQMPVMDGYTATREIRKWEGEKGLKATSIVALTAYATKEEEQKSLDAGCTAHLTKPIKKARMLEAIYNYTIKD